VKIDRSFVAELGRDSAARAVVESVIRIAATRGIKTVAEGVERPEQVEMLRELGCEYAQGFHFSHPLTPEEFERRFLSQ